MEFHCIEGALANPPAGIRIPACFPEHFEACSLAYFPARSLLRSPAHILLAAEPAARARHNQNCLQDFPIVDFPLAAQAVADAPAAPSAAVACEEEAGCAAAKHEAPAPDARRHAEIRRPTPAAQQTTKSPGRQPAPPVELLALWPGDSSLPFPSFCSRIAVPVLPFSY